MSFSFTTSGTPKAAIAEVGKQAALLDQLPQAFADAINGQLSGLPIDSSVVVACHGHTGWGEAQTAGQISMVVSINVVAAEHPSATT